MELDLRVGLPLEQYNKAKARERKLKPDALEAAETDQERTIIQEHGICDDFCEGDCD